MNVLENIKPKNKYRVIDLVQETGIGVEDWYNTSSNAASNPKYCYNWSHFDPNKVAVFNIWHQDIHENNDGNIYSNVGVRNFFNDNPKRSKSARNMDLALKTALLNNLPVRVIILDGRRRENGLYPAKVSKRELDPMTWGISSYDDDTGESVITRGAHHSCYTDQFEIPNNSNIKITGTSTSYVRDPLIRQNALLRSNGKCEYCNEMGFLMENNKIYLETHHIIPLSENGNDSIDNVIAICANDHKKAHFSLEKNIIRDKMQIILKNKLN